MIGLSHSTDKLSSIQEFVLVIIFASIRHLYRNLKLPLRVLVKQFIRSATRFKRVSLRPAHGD